jgi:hypothetical protein
MVVRVRERQCLKTSGGLQATCVGSLRLVAIPRILRGKTSSSQGHRSQRQTGLMAEAAEGKPAPLGHSLNSLTCALRHLVGLRCVEQPLVATRVLLNVLVARAPLLYAVPGVAVYVAAVLDNAKNTVVLLKLNVDLVASRSRKDRVTVAKELCV